jgi:hypothetical protein
MGDREPYRVEVEYDGCGECGVGKLYCIVGPDDVALGTSYENMEEAVELAAQLTSAYEAGEKER